MIVKPKVFQGSGTYKVRFFYWDIVDGVLTYKIIERYVNAGGTVIAPVVPTTLIATTKRSPALEFVSWNYSSDNLTNINQDIDVGAIYRNTTSGGVRKTHVFIVTTANTGLVVPIYFNKSDASTLTISWGDGSADYTTTSSGNLNTNHTYSTAGAYEITMWISSGAGTYSFGNTSSNNFIGGSNSDYRKCLDSLFIGDNVTTLPNYALYNMYNLRKLNIPIGVTSLGQYVLGYCRSLEYAIIPAECTSIGTSCFTDCYYLKNLLLGYGTTTLGDSILINCSTINYIIIPNSVTTLGASTFYNSSIVKAKISDNVTTIPTNTFASCAKLQEVIFSNSITSVGNSAFSDCVNLSSISIPNTVASLGDSSFYFCPYLKVMTVNRFLEPSDITTLGSTAFSSPNTQFRIYVPVGSGDVYKGATNWSTYTNRIYEDTVENRALFGD